jgi:hypothetical protein
LFTTAVSVSGDFVTGAGASDVGVDCGASATGVGSGWGVAGDGSTHPATNVDSTRTE